ncbi:hypothetical protein F2P81_011407 [Scophthalmus maximus]|uniref:Uncharacterized protein n=1 Tax=Scophthalmus maximus TaxID=52904 RepID=A0A6A4STU6_SCOMX|nr:hypothetical protein F2P81_011407 [Scophthalmus maximus]
MVSSTEKGCSEEQLSGVYGKSLQCTGDTASPLNLVRCFRSDLQRCTVVPRTVTPDKHNGPGRGGKSLVCKRNHDAPILSLLYARYSSAS